MKVKLDDALQITKADFCCGEMGELFMSGKISFKIGMYLGFEDDSVLNYCPNCGGKIEIEIERELI